jgi:4-diphosphocytidyl-2-C-methyl-D-erythritol kinase
LLRTLCAWRKICARLLSRLDPARRATHDPAMTGQHTLTLRAHAKINLCLAVSPPLPADAVDDRGLARGGYHTICSWFAPIDLHDDVTIEALPRGEDSRYTVEWTPDAPRQSPIDWPIEKDLAVRAHRLLEQHTRVGRALPVAMHIRKRIPVGGGLGGGSSDAAAVLVGVNQLFELGLSAADLVEISKALGSDVAFFIDEQNDPGGGDAPRAALVEGFGDRVTRIASPRCGVLLIVPPFGCPTGAVYKAYDRAPRAMRTHEVRALIARAAAGAAIDGGGLFNDLAVPACEVEPRLGELLARFRDRRPPPPPLPPVHITGSGSTMFTLTDDASVAARIRAITPPPEVVVVQTRIV